jgi:hypothetical protein
MFVPSTRQSLVCVWELLNFRGDSIKKLFKKQEAAIKKEVKSFVGANLKKFSRYYIRLWG